MAEWDHINALDVYPDELIKEIQKYYLCGYLWIPEPDNKRPGKHPRGGNQI
jgi:hypothetical protein